MARSKANDKSGGSGRIEVDQGDLHKILGHLGKIVDKKCSHSMMPRQVMIRTDDVPGIIVLAVNNLDTSLEMSLLATIDGKFPRTCIPYTALRKLVESPGKVKKTVVIEVTSNTGKDGVTKTTLGVTTDNQRMNVKCEFDPNDWVDPPNRNAASLCSMEGPAFAEALRYTLIAVSDDETRYNLNGILMESKKLVSTDGHRLHMADIVGWSEEPFILHKSAAALIARMAKENFVYVHNTREKKGDDNALAFVGKNWIVTTRPLNGTFPDYKNLLSKPSKKDVTFAANIEDTSAVLKRVAKLISPEYFVVLVTDGDKEDVTVTGKDEDLNEVSATIKAELITGNLRVGFNVKYLVDALKVPDKVFSFRTEDELTPIVLSFVGKTALVMPMRP